MPRRITTNTIKAIPTGWFRYQYVTNGDRYTVDTGGRLNIFRQSYMGPARFTA